MQAPQGTKPKAEISELDRIILEMIGQGATNTDIAWRTHYSLAAVKVRLRRLMRELGAKNRVELAAKTSQLSIAARELSAEGLTDDEMVFFLQFTKLPPATRTIIAEVGLVLAEALPEKAGQ